ncbi:14900_t:CDS:2 [Racocetra fulgida]|uniref:14900_t:CDS:1 n=1 Tax=Racocetra fulgida TaxID=60492 RepID=A0A9N8VVS2_9GLOM|nr:14900_t:CDS:2 [Racocetra fulgida]
MELLDNGNNSLNEMINHNKAYEDVQENILSHKEAVTSRFR